MSMLLFELPQFLQTLVEILTGLGTDDDGSNDVVVMVLVVGGGGMILLFLVLVHISMMMPQMMMMAMVMMSCGGGGMCLGEGVGIVLLGQDGGHRNSSLGGILIHRFLSAGCVHGGRRGGG